MDSIINTFHIDFKIILAQVLNFGIVFTVLYIYAIKPLGKIMKERSEKIEKGVSDAKVNAEILENTKKEYEKILAKARTEANDIFQQGKKEAESKRLEMLEKAKEDVTVMIENGKKTLETEKVKMINEAKKEVVAVAVKMTEKLLEKKIDGSLDEKTINELSNL